MTIIIAIGSNLDYHNQTPIQNIKLGIHYLKQNHFKILAQSNWWESEPDPPSYQPNYINAIVIAHSFVTPKTLLFQLHKIENLFGRAKIRKKNQARTLDLDLIDYHGLIYKPKYKGDLILPHPKMHERGFVLAPLSETNPKWKHPVLKKTVKDLYIEFKKSFSDIKKPFLNKIKELEKES